MNVWCCTYVRTCVGLLVLVGLKRSSFSSAHIIQPKYQMMMTVKTTKKPILNHFSRSHTHSINNITMYVMRLLLFLLLWFYRLIFFRRSLIFTYVHKYITRSVHSHAAHMLRFDLIELVLVLTICLFGRRFTTQKLLSILLNSQALL